MNMHSEIYNRIRYNIIKTWPAWKRKIYNSCLAVSAHAEKLPEDDRTRSTPVMTNYDRLISKTPGELAVFLSEATSNAIVVLGIGRNEKSKTAFDWYEWLKAPAEDGE